MIGKCDVCERDGLEVFEVETVHDEVIHCCDDCWNSSDKWDEKKEEVIQVKQEEKEVRSAVRLNTRVSADTNDWLDKKSFEMAISKSALVAVAVENYRKEVETVAALPTLLRKLEEMGIEVGDLPVKG